MRTYKRTTSIRRRMVATAINMMAKGSSELEVRTWCLTQGRSRSTSYEVVALANHELTRRLVKDRSILISRQSAKLDQAQKTAMSMEKAFVHWPQGEDAPTEPLVHKEPTPDLGAFTSAVGAQSRLLGLNAPERHEHHVQVNALLVDVAELVRDYLPTPELRRSFLEGLKARVQARLAAKPDLLPGIEAATREMGIVDGVGTPIEEEREEEAKNTNDLRTDENGNGKV